MGIHTDYCTVGNFGSEARMDYTIIGGGVNTASRLETSATPGEILISYETFAHVRETIACPPHGEIEVKGIAYPVATYQVVGRRADDGETCRRLREVQANLTLELDLEAMTGDERDEAVRVLRQALEMLSDGGDKKTAG